MSDGDQVRASIRVEVPIDRAFVLFTEHIDQWWRRGKRFRGSGARWGVMHLEPQVGGRLYETLEQAGSTVVLQTGEITAWSPPSGFALSWRALNFKPGEATQVVVEFEERGTATLVTVTHSGWAAIRADHPVRHGLDVPAFCRMMGMWWGDLLRSLREACFAHPPEGGAGGQAR